MAQRIATWLFAAFLLAVAGATGSWFLGERLVVENLERIAVERTAGGGTFEAKTVSVSGFPFEFVVDINDVHVSGRSARGPWDWRANHVRAHLSPWRPEEGRFELAGTHRVRFHAGRLPVNLEITAEKAPGQVTKGGGGAPGTVKVAPEGLEIRDSHTGAGLSAARARLELFHYPNRAARAGESAAGVLIDVRDAALPDGPWRVLGTTISRLGLETQVLGGLPQTMDRAALTRWRSQGGTLEIKNLAVQWGPARLEASGTAALDSALQPEAALTASIVGYDETVDALVAAKILREQMADGVKLVLSMLARGSRPGEKPVINVPLSLQDRTVFVGPARLLRLPAVKW